MPKPTAAPTAIHTPASIAQITERHAEQQEPVVRARSPSVEDATGDAAVQALVAPEPARTDDRGGHRAAATDDLDLLAADLAEQAVADDDEQHDEHGDVEDPLGHQRADHGAPATSARAGPSARSRIASPARAGSMLLPM